MVKKQVNFKKMAMDILGEFAGNVLIAIGTCNVALHAEFPISGFTGIAMLFYRMFHLPVGAMILVLNLIPAALCMMVIGKKVVLRTVRCMVMSAVLIDYVAPMFPAYQGDRLLAALVTGVLYGLGYALIYSRGSSTGGADFILLLMKKKFPYIKTGVFTFFLDLGIVVSVGFIYRDMDGIFMGLIINFLSATVIDKVILGMNSGNVAFIVTEHGRKIADTIDEVAMRGSTILYGEGGYKGAKKNVVMVAGSTRDIYKIRRAVKEVDAKSFTIIMDSNEVNGEGFRTTRMAGEE